MNYTACLVLIGVAERARSKCHSTRVSCAADWQFAHSTHSTQPASQTHFFSLSCWPVSPLHVRSANTPRHGIAKASFCAKVTDKNFLYISGGNCISRPWAARVEEMARGGEMLHDDLPLERRLVIGEQRLNSLLTLSLIFLSPAKCSHWAPTLAFYYRMQ